MRDVGESKWDRLEDPVRLTAAMAGGAALLLLLLLGLLVLENRSGLIGVGLWWVLVLGATGMLGLSAVAYVWPGSRWGWALITVLGAATMVPLVVLVMALWRMGLVFEGTLVFVGVGSGWLWWMWGRVSLMRKERREEHRGFEVVEARVVLMRDEVDLKPHRMEHPSRLTSVMVGAAALFLLLLLGLMVMEDRDGWIRSGWWWGWVVVATGMLGLSVMAFLRPRSKWGWALITVLGGVAMAPLVVLGVRLWRDEGVIAGAVVFVGVGLGLAGWVWVRVSAILKERMEEGKGFEVGEAGGAGDER